MTNTAAIHDPAELTRLIERRYHDRHRQQLAPLAKLAEMVEDLHLGDHGVPHGLSELLHRMIRQVDAHVTTEERLLFPAIRSGDGSAIGWGIAVTRADHDAHERSLAEIRRLTRDMTPPEEACTSWITLYAGLAEFEDGLSEHMRLEDDELFPRIERMV